MSKMPHTHVRVGSVHVTATTIADFLEWIQDNDIPSNAMLVVLDRDGCFRRADIATAQVAVYGRTYLFPSQGKRDDPRGLEGHGSVVVIS